MPDLNYHQFLRQLLTPARIARFDEILEQRTRAATVVLEDLYHPHNVSACLRTCEAFGVQDVHVVEDEHRFKSSQQVDKGASCWLTLHRYREPDRGIRSCLTSLKENGYRIVATALDENATTLEEIRLDRRTAFIFGSEKTGVSPDVRETADEFLKLPMYGFVQSFNVSVACALVLQRVVERIRAECDDWQLTEDEKHALRNEWIERAARRQHPRAVGEFLKQAVSSR